MKHQNRLVTVFVLLLAGPLLGADATDAPASQPTYHVYFGNTHAHTAYTWSHGDQWVQPKKGEAPGKLEIDERGAQKPPAQHALKPDWEQSQGPPIEHFKRAKEAGYDFYVTTDHSQEADFQPPGADNAKWQESKHAADEMTDASFVAIAGYEHSENNGPNGKGHLNVINSDAYLNALAPDVDLPKLYDWLKTAKPNGEGPVVASFNHPSPASYAEWGDRDDAVTDIITMLEVINSNNKIHESAFVAALDKGWKVSPCCGNDNHGFWGITHNTSRTGVLATERTKPAILDAMKQRRTYATLETNLQCRYAVNGAIMGSTLDRPSELAFDIVISDPDADETMDAITKIEIVRDGGVIAESYTPDQPRSQLEWKPVIRDDKSRYFYVRVYNAGGGDATNADPKNPAAWLAPVWTGR